MGSTSGEGSTRCFLMKRSSVVWFSSDRLADLIEAVDLEEGLSLLSLVLDWEDEVDGLTLTALFVAAAASLFKVAAVLL